MRKPAPATRFGLDVLVFACCLTVSLGGCGLGQIGPTPTPTATQVIYHLDASVSRTGLWVWRPEPEFPSGGWQENIPLTDTITH